MESEKIIGKKKLPSIPSNFVTLLQLQERWNKEREQKQKGKEEEEEEEAELQQREERETIVEERVDDEVPGRAGRKKGRFPRLNQDHGKRVAEGKPSDEIIAAAKDSYTEKKGEELKKKKKKKSWRNKKRNGIGEKARTANEGEEEKGRAGNALLPTSAEINEREEELLGDEAHASKLASAEKENVYTRKQPRPSIIPRTHGPKAEIGRKFQAMSTDGEVTTGVHAPKLVSVEEENVEARMESQPIFILKNPGRTEEIGRKFQAMSMNGETRTRYDRKYGRQNVDFNHRRAIWG
ncbi:cilia- and flagella-associated protein 251-like [Hibiscus syriacus]|uniref:cilia- and flagella-associated protein 251-like n=1 Tax=Hibiscus syriacus TaxID=106335 RepID=UPI001921DD55|nr:cilia- and flagella-associated protein 251-like [Hibiscus syriacus]